MGMDWERPGSACFENSWNILWRCLRAAGFWSKPVKHRALHVPDSSTILMSG
jgi:hypothetical protein